MVDAQHKANSGALVVASYKAPTGSGHIAVLRPSNRTDSSVNSLGPEICQSEDFNFQDTNVSTGFSQHPGAFPNGINYYGHSVEYPISPVTPVLGQALVSNQVFMASTASVVGRRYEVQSSTNLAEWTSLVTFTNSNDSTNFYVQRMVTDPLADGCFYRVLAR